MGVVVGERYRLERQLGEGGMGSVWAATHVLTGKHVAVKLLKEELARDPNLVERFVREARAACAVVHPNVVQIHDVIQGGDGPPAMVMDLLHGESLGERLERGPLGLAELVAILGPVLSAVAAAHRAGIVHRDLKPDNLFLARRPDGALDVKVLDFGIAKITSLEGEVGPHTKTGALVGTPFYMSPEQLFGEKDIDGRSDVWSMGIIVWECLVGRRPTQTDNLGQIVKIVTQTGIPPLATVLPDVPGDVSDVVARMLARDRTARIASLDEVSAVLARHRTGAPQLVTAPPPPPSPPAVTPSPWSRSAPQARPGPRAPLAIVGGLVPLTLLLTAALVLGRPYYRARFRPPPTTATSLASSPPPVAPAPPPPEPAVASAASTAAASTSAPRPSASTKPSAGPLAPPGRPTSPALPIHGEVPF